MDKLHANYPVGALADVIEVSKSGLLRAPPQAGAPVGGVLPGIEWVFELVGEKMVGCATLNFMNTSLA